MINKPICKMVLDVTMTIGLLLLMAFELVGDQLHEWIGTGIFLLFILHHALNVQWLKHLTKGRYTPYRVLQTILVLGCFATMVGCMVSGMILSQYLFAALPISGLSAAARVAHLLCSYWGFVFMSLHLGLHWGMVCGGVRKILKSTPSRICALLLRFSSVGIAFYGIKAMFGRELFSYLFYRTHFVMFNFEESLIFFFWDYLAMMGSLVFLAHYGSRLLIRLSVKRKCEDNQ